MSNHTRRTPSIVLVCTALAGSLLLSGCGEGDPEPKDSAATASGAQAPEVAGASPSEPTSEPSKPSKPSATSGPATPPTATTVSDKGLQQTAEKFIDERENQASYERKKPQDWIGAVKPYMTAAGHKELAKNAGGGVSSGGNAWAVAHDEGLAVKTEVSPCKELSQAGSTKTRKTVTCPVTDIVVGKDGKNVPTTKVPPMWPYVGEQQDALLEMGNEGGGWKVNRDVTGMAN